MSFIAEIDSGDEFDRLSRIEPAPAVRTYFESDCAAIVDAAQASPDAFPGIAALVLCSIRQPFFLMHEQIADVAENGLEAQCLFGWKRDGLRYVQEHKRELYRAARAAFGQRGALDGLILDYLAIPGLGIVKASFLAQMTIGEGACLDSHNLATLGLALNAFKTSKTLKIDSIRKRIRTYNATWRAQGSSAYWWDSWCDAIAARYPGWFKSGAEVSARHRIATTGGVR